MRKLNTQDIFNFTKIMKAANLKEELQPLFSKGKDINTDVEINIKQLGIEAILTIIEACGNAGVEDKVYKFLSGPFEMNEVDIAKLSIESLFEKVEHLSKENNLILFFKRAATLMK